MYFFFLLFRKGNRRGKLNFKKKFIHLLIIIIMNTTVLFLPPRAELKDLRLFLCPQMAYS